MIALHSHAHYDFSIVTRVMNKRVAGVSEPILQVYTSGLWDIYLDQFPDAATRQEHNCRCCRKFIEDYGGLVTISETGGIKSLFFSNPEEYKEFAHVFTVLKGEVERRGITNVFKTDRNILGTPHAGGWDHFYANMINTSCLNTDRLNSASQVMAKSVQDRTTLETACVRYPASFLGQVLSLLEYGNIPNSQLVIGMAKWYYELGCVLGGKKGKVRDRILWRAVATAPVGFIGMQSSVLATLLDDIQAGKDSNTVIDNFRAKTHGLNYQRPKTLPGAQNAKRAGDIIEKLGLTGALKRRFATLEDLELDWYPPAPKKPLGHAQGVFKDVAVRQSTQVTRPVEYAGDTVTMTYNRFSKKILPTATKIEVLAPYSGNYAALVTAADPTAPNILQWSNPVSWYVYSGGSKAINWGIDGGTYVEVTGITKQPNMWKDECAHQGESIFFVLRGAVDKQYGCSALFPSLLKNELHEVRKTIEEFSKSVPLQHPTRDSIAALRHTDTSRELDVRVTSNTGTIIKYRIKGMD